MRTANVQHLRTAVRRLHTERAAAATSAPRVARSGRAFHSNGATALPTYTPYYRAYYGQHMLQRCPQTGLATGVRATARGQGAGAGSATPAAAAGKSYAPYQQSYYGAHMLGRATGQRTFCTAAAAARADSSATPLAAVEEEDGAASVSASPSSSAAGGASPPGTAMQRLSDSELLGLLRSGEIPHHQLENLLDDCARAVRLRRAFLGVAPATGTTGLPIEDFDSSAFYTQVKGANCENVVGYLTMPVGVVGPLRLDGLDYTVPMATTEGALVASTNRGARAISLSGGAQSAVLRNGMTRAPALRMTSAMQAAELKAWCEQGENLALLRDAFASTSRFGRLQSLDVHVAGRNAFMRFRCASGDAMGMNMVSKGVEAAMVEVLDRFAGCSLLTLSGNVCVDKKPSALNWIEGRGKSVVVESTLTGDVVERVLKTSVADLCEVNISKNLVGTAVAGSIGGNNAHASNIVSAVFLATGQDPAQNVESSTCMTLFEPANGGKDVHVSCTMPSIEVGTIGGGTTLPAQAAGLDMLGLRGAADTPGANAERLAQVIAGTVLCGEVSLMSALASGHLVSSHMRLNRAAPKAE